MSGITTFVVPKELILKAKGLGINCSKTAREALKAEISKAELEKESKS
jgi:post-segregation antitoxin (ccd killing protein)